MRGFYRSLIAAVVNSHSLHSSSNPSLILQRSWMESATRASYLARGFRTSRTFLGVEGEGREVGGSISGVEINMGNREASSPLVESSGGGRGQHSPPALIDADCNFLHADMPPLTSLLYHESTKAANIVAYLSPASTLEESERMLEVLKTLPSSPSSSTSSPFPQIKTTVGVHPYHASEAPPLSSLASKITECLSDDKLRPYIAAVGETGLDYSEGEARRTSAKRSKSRKGLRSWVGFLPSLDPSCALLIALFALRHFAHRRIPPLLRPASCIFGTGQVGLRSRRSPLRSHSTRSRGHPVCPRKSQG